MSNQAYTPGVGNEPKGLLNTNPQGSNYAAESEFTPEESNLIAKEIKRVIFDAAPKQFLSMKVLFSQEVEEKGSDEFEYLEYTFGRTSPVLAAGAATTAAAAAVPGAPNTHVSHTFNLTAASLEKISVDNIITYPNGDEGVVVSIAGNIVTINSLTGGSLPGVAAGDVLAIRSTIMADADDAFSHYDRTEVITRYNYVQFFLRAKRWGRVEMQKYINMGNTNFLDVDKKEKVRQLRYDMFISYWNGHRGEYNISGNRKAKSMGGIYPTMVASSSANANPTLGGLGASFESLAMSTNFKTEGGTRFVYGTHQSLHELSKIYKVPNLRYTTSVNGVNLDLEKIVIGGATYALVPCELFKNSACFPSAWAKRLIVLDQDTIRPVKMKGIPLVEMGETDDLQKGSYRQYKDFWCKAQLSIEFNNPQGSFYIDIQ